MLIDDLGYRPARQKEVWATLKRRLAGRFVVGQPGPGAYKLPSATLRLAPVINYSGIVPSQPIGASGLAGAWLRGPSWFLISPTWSIEDSQHIEAIRARAVLHRLFCPHHRLVFLCNTEAERDLLHAAGEAAIHHNKTSFVPDDVFHPLPDAETEFDAIYNAQLAPFKRHELSLDIPTCAFIHYRAEQSQAVKDFGAALIQRHAAVAPGHVFLNPTTEKGRPEWFGPERVNAHLNRASVGLCLSEVEGAMIACTEYLLAGLAVVTTPATGGRESLLDPEFSLIAQPNPRDVAEAVAALKARNIPRAYVRERALALLNRHRAAFRNLVDGILAEAGSDQRLAEPWPFTKTPTSSWKSSTRTLKHLIAGRVDDFGQKFVSADRKT